MENNRRIFEIFRGIEVYQGMHACISHYQGWVSPGTRLYEHRLGPRIISVRFRGVDLAQESTIQMVNTFPKTFPKFMAHAPETEIIF